MEGTIILNGIHPDQLMESLSAIVKKAVNEELKKVQDQKLQEQFLSSKEVCKLFKPSISLVTLNAWAQKNLIKKYHISGRVYYKAGEVLDSVTALKKYKKIHP